EKDQGQEDVLRAMNDVQNKNCTFREAENRYGVPIAVIYNRIKGRKTHIEKMGAGCPPVFNSDTEGLITTCLIARSQIGYPVDKEELKNLVVEYVKSNNLITPFKNGTLERTAIGEKGKPVCRVSEGTGRKSTTVLTVYLCRWSFLPPLIVFKGAAVQARWTTTEGYPDTLYAASCNGWMEKPSLPYQTAVLIYDGHLNHISIRIIEEAIKNNIKLVRLPSHLTDRIQPLDKCVFGPIMVKWDKQLVEHGRKQMGQGSGRLTKDIFGVHFGQVLQEAVSIKNVQSEFLSTGVFPLDSLKFPIELFDPYDLRKHKTRVRAKAALFDPPSASRSISSELPNDVPPHVLEKAQKRHKNK
ncbi:hypothetical protein ILUMI_18785, partial [Ignelater luminosus]